VTVQIQNLDLDSLFRSIEKPHPSPTLARLGRFRGVAEFTNAANFRLIGEQAGVEFVFSNKGQRETQSIQRMQGDLRRREGVWNLTVDRIELDQGVFSGDLAATASPDFKELELRLRSEGFTLSPAVQRLMTRDGSLGRLQAHVDLKLRDGVVRGVKGRVQIPEMRLEGMAFENLVVGLETSGEEVVVSPRTERLRLSPSSPAWALLGGTLPASWRSADGDARLAAVQGQFRLRDFSKLRWTSFSARGASPSSRLQSKGGWDENGLLQGDLRIQSSEGTRSWKLQGTRDEPILTPSR
jgi:hypothetical protein